MEKIKCSYPGCKKEQENKQNFELIDEEDASVDLGFCKYHSYIVMGGHFKARVNKTPAILPTKKEPKGTPEKIDFELIGPLREIEIVEQVFGAIEMIKLENGNKDLKTN